MTRQIVVYALIDGEGRRRYVGKTHDLAGRLRDHRRRGKPWAASLEVLEHVGSARWVDRERYWVSYGHAQGWPLENKNGGGGGPDTHTPETRAQLSCSQRGRVASTETRAKMSAAGRGRKQAPHTAATRAKISMAKRGRRPWNKGLVGIYSADTRAKISAGQVGRVQSAETIERRAAKTRGRICTAETRAKISAANKGQVPWCKGRTGIHSAAGVAKLAAAASQRNRGRIQSAEERAKRSAALKGRRFTAERCLNISNGLRHSDAHAKASAALKGRRSPMAGRRHTPATRALISAALLRTYSAARDSGLGASIA